MLLLPSVTSDTKIEITKSTEENKNVSEIEFTLSGTSDSGREISLTAKTGLNGTVRFDAVPIGKYTISENGETVNTAYLVSKDKSVEVTYGETSNVIFTNLEKKGFVERRIAQEKKALEATINAFFREFSQGSLQFFAQPLLTNDIVHALRHINHMKTSLLNYTHKNTIFPCKTITSRTWKLMCGLFYIIYSFYLKHCINQFH